MIEDEDLRTVQEAVADLLGRLEDGSSCPCCGQFVKAYKRKLRANHVRFLLDLVRLAPSSDDGWVHYSDCFYVGRDYNFLVHFGLAEWRIGGYWRPTGLGVAFVQNDVRAPEWVLVYNNHVIRQADREISIRDCLASGDFDYDALMVGAGS